MINSRIGFTQAFGSGKPRVLGAYAHNVASQKTETNTNTDKVSLGGTNAPDIMPSKEDAPKVAAAGMALLTQQSMATSFQTALSMTPGLGFMPMLAPVPQTPLAQSFQFRQSDAGVEHAGLSTTSASMGGPQQDQLDTYKLPDGTTINTGYRSSGMMGMSMLSNPPSSWANAQGPNGEKLAATTRFDEKLGSVVLQVQNRGGTLTELDTRSLDLRTVVAEN
jgi:hypothetical protein